MESGHRFDAQTLHSFIQAVFRQMGSEEQEAKLVADHLIAANLAGHDSHGIGMIPSYVLMNPLMILVKIIKLRWI
ncbi:Ldh family oxidoreductase, partial [Escherichia coli]|nr:Ldh family oxidoreductase [Escherichia coli]